MKELPKYLEEHCREVLSECVEFDSEESMRIVLDDRVLKQYSKFVRDQHTRDNRIEECIKGLKDRRYKGKCVLALFLEILSERYPDGDDTRAALKKLANDILRTLKTEGTAEPLSLQAGNSMYQVTQNVFETEPQEILIIRGQNDVGKIEVSEFLKGAGFLPVEWDVIAGRTGKNSPSTDEVLRTAFDTVRAVVVVFTGDDIVASMNENLKDEQKPHLQSGPDIFFKAGVAFGIDATRTILVALGKLRPFTDPPARHMILLTNKSESRGEFIWRLKGAGCNPIKSDWTVKGNFHNPSFYQVLRIEIKRTTTDDL